MKPVSRKRKRPPPPASGIKLRNIGATWWGQRWTASLESLSRDYLRRMGHGRVYAREGRVHQLHIEPGKVTALVAGSEPEPYEVTLRLETLDARAWRRVIAAMAQQALFAAELLAGQMPKEIERVFRACGQQLFPSKQRDIETDCTCPDWASPCKHVAATHYVLGEAFDKDPFLLFELRGRTKEQVLEGLSRLRGEPSAVMASSPAALIDSASASIPSVTLTADSAFEARAPIPKLQFRFDIPPQPAPMLQQLGSPASWSLEQTPHQLLAWAIAKASAMAQEVAMSSPDEELTKAPEF